jgi:hypothetical protein
MGQANGALNGLVLPAGGMDGLSKRLIETEAKSALNKIMRRGRQAYVVIVASDGPHGCLSQAHSAMTAGAALAFAQALADQAASIRADVARGKIKG